MNFTTTVSENIEIIIWISLGIAALITLPYIKKRDHLNIRKDLELKGFRVLRIRPYRNAFKDFPKIPGKCYAVSYEDNNQKGFIEYCFCSMTDPVIWVKL
ncbi:MAG: hypothetical protein NE334_15455 [Lentisphaeraceae bacterium]|nr:hypothetical protein [Lentisphaeraceae bacterium]